MQNGELVPSVCLLAGANLAQSGPPFSFELNMPIPIFLSLLCPKGVVNRLGRAYSLVRAHRSFAHTVRAGFEWLSYHLPNVDRMVFYFCQDCESLVNSTNSGPVERTCYLELAVMKNGFEPAVLQQAPSEVHRTDSTFMNYLFTVADTSEPYEINLFGTRHVVLPIRDSDNVAFGLIDIYGRPMNEHHACQSSEQEPERLNTLLGILSVTSRELMHKTGTEIVNLPLGLDESETGETELELKPDDKTDAVDPFKTEAAFERLVLAEFHKACCSLTDEVFAELSTYTEPPSVIVEIVDAFFSLVDPENQAIERCHTEQWNEYRSILMDVNWHDRIDYFDPNKPYVEIVLKKIEHLFSASLALMLM
ncbi:unnamed protein product [Echinostoma caproni]|uniref:GAF domain-containing protein n=1 Tax=Echinostoma caproni TaxID=27848 RepID=A0A183AC57_9TREM|nr:unnamed protein product [Echinostoma caproni]